MKQNIAILTMLVLIISACSPAIKEEPMKESTTEEKPINESTAEEEPADDGMLKITLEELKLFDGTNGNPAYIAIDGIIYDVTNIPNWNGGIHNGYKAGNDLSKEMKEISPHGLSKLKLVEAVGEIID